MRNDKTSLTTRQLADSLGVSESSVKRWVDDGLIAAHRTAGGHRRIPMSAAIGFIRRNRSLPEKPQLLDLPATPVLGTVDPTAVGSLFDAFVEDHPNQARAIITGRYIAGADIATIGDGLIRPVLQRIGDMWRSDEGAILIEHRAVETCVQILAELAAWLPPLPESGPVAITAAGPADPYLLGPILASLSLRERGIIVRNLGPMTPFEIIVLALKKYNANLCSISVGVNYNTKDNQGWQSVIDTVATTKSKLVVGGRCVDTLSNSIRERAIVCNSMVELAAFATGLLQAGVKSNGVVDTAKKHA